ncbi:hypothetical protein MB46_17395 [Arthrobacter alpinus]|uniref:septum site-determining protein Ssd n=1 Tax=Arthrobacter alpinus TaxID=656366 RepID=UPI0006784959|nr:septum site-determining protein Ssd [Arthrobacter alpinus]ALV46989.1 hypothetical protein MB46_17395 [Arthrobacter alpinus]
MRSNQRLPNGPTSEPWLPHRDTTVLLLSASSELQGAVGRVSAAAAVELLVGQSWDEAAARWDDIAAVMIDAAAVANSEVEAGIAGWRGPIVVVGLASDSALMWHEAERLGADRVAILPDSAPWLANYLSCLRNPASGAGVVGIVGGCGGAGASTLATLVAAGAVKRGVRTLLVDGDPWGGGLCGALSAEEVPGLHWPELLRASGAINPDQLAASLPYFAGLAVLSWDAAARADQQGVPQDTQAHTAVGEVMRAARGAYGLVVVDLGRTPDAFRSLAWHCDGLVVVVPARPRSAAATLPVIAALPPKPVVAVVRGPLGEGLDADRLASAVGLPLAGTMPRLRGATDWIQAERWPDTIRRRPVRRLVGKVLGWMAGDEPSTTPTQKGELMNVAGRR